MNVRAQTGQAFPLPEQERYEEPMDVSLIQTHEPALQPTSDINAFQPTRPKRAIKGQQFHSSPQSPPSTQYGAPTPSSADQNKAIANLQRQVSGLANQFTALMSRVSAGDNVASQQHTSRSDNSRSFNAPTSAPRRQIGRSQNAQVRTFPSPLEYTFDGKPICLFCKNPGHVKRDCRKKAAADARRFQGGQ